MKATACLCVLLLSPSFAQTPKDSLTFEVASMKLHPPGSSEGIATTQTGGPGTSDPARITIINRTLHRLLIEAYVLKGFQLRDPPELDQIRYDIAAEVVPGATAEEARIMLQNLLVERLQLKVRRAHEVIPVWALLVNKGGPKFKPSPETAASPSLRKTGLDAGGFPDTVDRSKPGIYRASNSSGSLRITVVHQTIAQFVSALFGQTDRPIMDLTELTGTYDFSVVFGARWKMELAAAPSDAPELPDAASIFEAVKQQLGLKLEARKMPADLVIVDSGQKTPVDN